MSARGDGKNRHTARQLTNSIIPGPCDPVYGCPPPTEIVCIVAEMVYDQYKSVRVNKDEFIFEADPDNPVSEVTCRNAELLDGPHCMATKAGRVRVTFTYRINLQITLLDDQVIDLYKDFTVTNDYHIPRAGEQRLRLRCSVPFLECLSGVVKYEEPDYDFIKTVIICCIGIFVLIKLTSAVQLMIPAYGFCPEPPDCEEVLAGEEYPDLFPWLPYPPEAR